MNTNFVPTRKRQGFFCFIPFLCKSTNAYARIESQSIYWAEACTLKRNILFFLRHLEVGTFLAPTIELFLMS